MGPMRGFFAAGSNGALAEALTRRDLDPAGTGLRDIANLAPVLPSAGAFFMPTSETANGLPRWAMGTPERPQDPQRLCETVSPGTPATAGAFFVVIPRPSRNTRSLGTPSVEAHTPGPKAASGVTGDGDTASTALHHHLREAAIWDRS